MRRRVIIETIGGSLQTSKLSSCPQYGGANGAHNCPDPTPALHGLHGMKKAGAGMSRTGPARLSWSGHSTVAIRPSV
ncbi:hypothetical protein MACH21_09850 [Roseicyclus marinus]|uniref:Uncharacterized protein n=1 Tax=Roseicyclus marinus TaxID=2161673 RepID=A0AA48KJG1_9RHOB|nr:hypothetical protein MACH21_09850 [Roseicyclus marinus]